MSRIETAYTQRQPSSAPMVRLGTCSLPARRLALKGLFALGMLRPRCQVQHVIRYLAGLQDGCMLPAIVDARANERRDLSKTSRTFFAIVSQIIPGILVSWTENHRIPG